jgi:hypothetical protein
VTTAIEVASWRRETHQIYAAVRAESDPAQAHRLWQAQRNELFAKHPQSPLLPDDPMRASGLPYFPYDPALRFTIALDPADGPDRVVTSANDGDITMRRVGTLTIPSPVEGTLDVWWLTQYGGGIFVPVRDATSANETYGGGRYLLDTIKGADLGDDGGAVVVDFNFLYHPSCRYNPAWECPLAPEGNTVASPVRAGERL